MDLLDIPRHFPQFGKHLSSLLRPASEVFAEQGKGKASCGCGAGTYDCSCSIFKETCDCGYAMRVEGKDCSTCESIDAVSADQFPNEPCRGHSDPTASDGGRWSHHGRRPSLEVLRDPPAWGLPSDAVEEGRVSRMGTPRTKIPYGLKVPTPVCGAEAALTPWWIWWLLSKALWYGNYCGPASKLPGNGPINGLDACCQVHDICYQTVGAEWWNALPGCGTPGTAGCDAALCACARAFNCNGLPLLDQPHCAAYRLEMIGWFC